MLTQVFFTTYINRSDPSRLGGGDTLHQSKIVDHNNACMHEIQPNVIILHLSIGMKCLQNISNLLDSS